MGLSTDLVRVSCSHYHIIDMGVQFNVVTVECNILGREAFRKMSTHIQTFGDYMIRP